ncbi:MAG: glycosyl transferase family 2 [Bacteroidetes bacterium]|nr:MAG: glycosyl transferase family 2 [Bacteroidota bacterium]
MKLSVVIVNYNVEHFLEQCLLSVRKAMQAVSGEVFVVDNNSIDGSVKMVKDKFPEVKLIVNRENLGFSKANNQAMKMAFGEYLLLLNPDTVVEDDTFSKVVAFMDSHPDAGGLGVKMVDGSGNFLPESKRGLPTPEAAFYKMFGISKIFPKSKRFSKYHLGYLDEDQIHEVEILAGAFMLMRKSVLDKIGLLDESFFMYGEDIDLSYRIIKAGYKNYYFPETRIIHYKGESTKKSSVNYVLVFYKAMVIFARKHFTQKNVRLLTNLINIAIYFRAFIAILSRFFNQLIMPVADGLLMFGGMMLIKEFWGRQLIYPEGGDYPQEYIHFVIPSYIVIWLAAIFFNGGYDKPLKIRKVIQGILVGTITILVFYALLPEQMRFSRAMILLGTLWGVLALPVLRLVLHWMGVDWIQLGEKKRKRFLIIGDDDETGRVSSILNESYIKPEFVGLANPLEDGEVKGNFIGNLTQVKDIIAIYKIDEVIFCSKNINHQQIIDKMADWQETRVDYKIAPEDSLSIIGSNSINTRGDLYTVDINTIDKPANRRNKRLIDMLVSIFVLGLAPLLIFFEKKPARFVVNIFKVMAGRLSWVGYHAGQNQSIHLPKLKPGILSPLSALEGKNLTPEMIDKANMLYARDYSAVKDLNIIIRSFNKLGS